MASEELVSKLTAYVKSGTHSVSTADAAFLEDSLDEAIALVNNECGTAIDRVPVAVLYRAYLECGSELYQRKNAPQGVTQFASPDGGTTPVRTSRDPMSGARLILRPFLGGGFA
ncbi:hypothetical protein JVX92_00720 [Microbacterium hominis]|uniref:hypothetical protein n=1 Tax=Microbacterium hominis TaxID=162426 RepID=UPI00196417EA|nr:hypothetical protein [Microbacterium hominis]QRY40851.1 hypothetical protein JVX92_00720 [Microbacterium hominis]